MIFCQKINLSNKSTFSFLQVMMSHSPDIWPGLTESSVIAPFYVIILMHNWVITKNFVPKQNKKMKKKNSFFKSFFKFKKTF